MKLEFSRLNFEKNAPISNFMKIVSMAAELFHTDVFDEAVILGNSANVPKSVLSHSINLVGP